jgi:cysteinyl-tRNA synthetase
MSAHYKQPLDWNDKLLEDSKSTIDKWYQMFVSIKNKIKIPETMLLPLYDDLNTPGYIGNIHKLFDKANSGNSKDKEIFVSACNFVGLLNETKEQWLEFKKTRSSISENEILSKINLRNKARESKGYGFADKIRKELLDKGVLIEDKNGKTIWKYK